MPDTKDAPQKASPKAPDGGWSWVVAGCAFFDTFIFMGLPITFGLLFHEKLTQLGASSTMMTVMFSMFSFNFSALRIFSPALSDVFSWRSVSFVTTCVTALGFVCMVFVHDAAVLCFLFSIVVGCSAGIGISIAFLIIPHYFDIHRGRAGALIITGSSTSQIVLPLLLHLFLQDYGFSGTCLLFGGIILNCATLNLLIYPVNKRPLLKGDAMFEAMKNVSQEKARPKKNDNHVVRDTQGTELSLTQFEQFKKVFRLAWLSISQLQHMRLLIVTMSYTVFLIGYQNFLAFLPFAMAAKGHPPSKASYCISVGGVPNVLTRIFIIWGSDAKWFNRRISYIFGTLLTGVSTFVAAFVVHDTRLVMACTVVAGVGMGATLSVFYNLMIDTCGRELYSAGVAAGGLLLAVCSIVTGPLIGVVTDYTSFQVSMSIASVLQLMCPALWLLMPLAEEYDQERFNENRKFKGEELKITSSQSKNVDVPVRDGAEGGQVNKGFSADVSPRV